jgi:hypothetical protein
MIKFTNLNKIYKNTMDPLKNKKIVHYQIMIKFKI